MFRIEPTSRISVGMPVSQTDIPIMDVPKAALNEKGFICRAELFRDSIHRVTTERPTHLRTGGIFLVVRRDLANAIRLLNFDPCLRFLRTEILDPHGKMLTEFEYVTIYSDIEHDVLDRKHSKGTFVDGVNGIRVPISISE